MKAKRVIVCESTDRWKLALRTLLDEPFDLTAAADLPNAFTRFCDESTALLAVEVTEACAEECLRRLCAIRQQAPHFGVLVLLQEASSQSMLGSDFSVWYEAGAMAVVSSPTQLPTIKHLIQQYFQSQQPPASTFREEVLRKIPWNELETEH